MTIGIVGVGGLGVILVEQIMRLYPHKIIIIDKDKVELSNLNRLTNATLDDASNHTPKVEVSKRAVLSNNPNQKITIINNILTDLDRKPLNMVSNLISLTALKVL